MSEAPDPSGPDAVAVRLSELAAEARMLGDRQQAMLEHQLATLEDVTAEFLGRLAETGEDTIYRAPDGTLVKIKAFEDDETDHGLASAKIMTGSIVGSDGKALLRADGSPALWKQPHRQHVQAFGLGNPQADEERERRRAVLQTLWAERTRQLAVDRADGPTPGVARLSAFKARKAREAGVTEPAALAALHADVDPNQWTSPAALAPVPMPPARHPSGRRYVLHPGNVVGPDGTLSYVGAAELAAAYGVKFGQCVMFSGKRPASYFRDLVELWPLPPGATYPDHGAQATA